MNKQRFKQIWMFISQKNVLLTIIAFILGLALQLTEMATILLVVGVAVVSTWWQWRPYSINVENKLILKTLQSYPAVLIRNYPHIIAFDSSPCCLIAAYQSSVPRKLLKQALPNIGGMEINISQMGVDIFLLLKAPLTPYTQIMKVFQTFQSVIDLLELQLQTKFNPAERYQTICLFGFTTDDNFMDNYYQVWKTLLGTRLKEQVF
ncbi:MAG: hypothetical protein ACFFC7_27735 [Candidatus Hermodarchaeota archaeon]